nr:hypothetical protein [Candidatus Sigynarchaeota archaeon]
MRSGKATSRGKKARRLNSVLLAVGAGYFFMIFFFCLERVIHFKLPLLSAFGRNGLLLYMSCLVFFLMLVGSGIYDAITPGTAWLGLLLVISVFVVLAGIATTLDKRKLYLHL